MKPKTQLLDELSILLNVKTPFRPCNISIPRIELEKILNQLQNFKKPKNFRLKGERPLKNSSPCEANTHYRERISKYIEFNNGIKIPVNSGVPSSFYNAVVDYLGL
ncbi:MAG: hypothetical protein NT139_02795 [Candidatus Woesearchaeota archaeon]|nr:hypothetical protein [Candidatus Woesearchaeota archaeon]